MHVSNTHLYSPNSKQQLQQEQQQQQQRQQRQQQKLLPLLPLLPPARSTRQSVSHSVSQLTSHPVSQLITHSIIIMVQIWFKSIPALVISTFKITIMEFSVFATSDGSIPMIRPCVDCGLITGNFCDGGISVAYDRCFAAERIPSERWNNGQRTPLCNRCENEKSFCRFCRRVHGCTPFTRHE